MNARRLAALHRQLAELHAELADAFEAPAEVEAPPPRRRRTRALTRDPAVEVSEIDRRRASAALRRAGLLGSGR